MILYFETYKWFFIQVIYVLTSKIESFKFYFYPFFEIIASPTRNTDSQNLYFLTFLMKLDMAGICFGLFARRSKWILRLKKINKKKGIQNRTHNIDIIFRLALGSWLRHFRRKATHPKLTCFTISFSRTLLTKKAIFIFNKL